MDRLHGQVELLALEDPARKSVSRSEEYMWDQSVLGVVNVEEVRVQNSLNQTCDDRNRLKVALSEPAVDPVGDVKGSVSTEGEQIVGGDSLCFAGSLQHEQLGQNGDSFQPD